MVREWQVRERNSCPAVTRNGARAHPHPHPGRFTRYLWLLKSHLFWCNWSSPVLSGTICSWGWCSKVLWFTSLSFSPCLLPVAGQVLTWTLTSQLKSHWRTQGVQKSIWVLSFFLLFFLFPPTDSPAATEFLFCSFSCYFFLVWLTTKSVQSATAAGQYWPVTATGNSAQTDSLPVTAEARAAALLLMHINDTRGSACA